jgi:hypothetical protein
MTGITMIRITAQRGTTSFVFEVQDSTTREAIQNAEMCEQWLSAQPERQELNDRRSLQRSS